LIIILKVISLNSKKLPQDLAKHTWENTRPADPVYSIDEIPLTPKARRQMRNLEISKTFELPPPHSVKSIYEISQTPKALFLENHFGTHPFDEEYGPNTPKPIHNSPNSQYTEPHMMSFATGEVFNVDD
jgi:hypothetical protein